MSKNKFPHILLTNDDGIHAPGLRHLWNSLKNIAKISVIAPESEKSGVGMCITCREPLRIKDILWKENTPAWSVSGTPADCIKLALGEILTDLPDLIVSGINNGSNAGRNVLYSGTVGGAIEGVFRGIPSFAVSCVDYNSPDYSIAEPYIEKLANYLLSASPLPKGTLLNVNFPSKTHKNIKGFRLARQGKSYWMENIEKRKHPEENFYYYWLGAKLTDFDEEHEDSDISLLKKGFITAVPINIEELTDHEFLNKKKKSFIHI